MAVADFVKQAVGKPGVVLFTKDDCGFCSMVKGIFDDMGVKYDEHELNSNPDGPEIQEFMQEFTGARSVPRVFVNGKFIGGGTETRKLHKAGELQAVVEAPYEES